MDKFFPSKDASPVEDLYELLGCDETSTEEQIATEFKQLAKKYHPDKASSGEEKAAAMFIKLDKARKVLLDREKRAKYDVWRSGGFKSVISFEKWFEMQGRAHSSMHWTPPPKPVPALLDAGVCGTEKLSGGKESSLAMAGAAGDGGGVAAKAQPTASLEDFRRGQGGGSQLNNFRNYNF